MKQFLTALGGGIIGAVLVLAVQAGFIKPKYADMSKMSQFAFHCYLGKMADVHTERSAIYVEEFCRIQK